MPDFTFTTENGSKVSIEAKTKAEASKRFEKMYKTSKKNENKNEESKKD